MARILDEHRHLNVTLSSFSVYILFSHLLVKRNHFRSQNLTPGLQHMMELTSIAGLAVKK